MSENQMLKKAKYIVRLDNVHFKESHEVTCLGKQFAQILSCLTESTKTYDWYIFDIRAGSEVGTSNLFPKMESQPYSLISSTQTLIERVKQVHQFDTGVFIAIPKGEHVEWDNSVLPETEEDLFIQHPKAELEIRTFDFSYFEIYIQNEDILTALKSCFTISDGDLVE